MSNEARRRFPAPWSVVEVAEAFVVVDAAGRRLCFTYFDEVARGANSTRWMRPEARQVADAVAALPEGAALPSLLQAPCRAEDKITWFKVKDAAGRDVCALYVDHPRAGSLTWDEARRIAVGVVRLNAEPRSTAGPYGDHYGGLKAPRTARTPLATWHP